jgi:predicted phosphodiesterase
MKNRVDLQAEEVIRVLHLSDFHFRTQHQWDAERVLLDLTGDIRTFVDRGLQPHMVVLSGDLAFSGQRSEYLLASQWIDEYLVKTLPGFDKKDLFIIPGNHDVDRRKVTVPILELEEDARRKGQDAIASLLKGKAKKDLLRRHQEYLRFANQHRNNDSKLKEIWWAEKRKFGNTVVGVAGLASSLMSSGDKDRGNPVVSRFQLNEVFKHLENVDICLVVIHHPLDYLHEHDKKEVEERIKLKCSVLLRGHLHEKKTVSYRDPDHQYLELATGSVYAGSRYRNAFQLIELDISKRKARVHYRCWEDGAWRADLMAYKGSPTGIGKLSLRVFRSPSKIKREKGKNRDDVLRRGVQSTPLTVDTLIWTRTLLELPLKTGVVRKVRELLGTIRMQAFEYLQGIEPRLLDRQVRANIFIADYRQAGDGVGYVLCMAEELRINMNHPSEWHMKFRPGQGATGMVFSEGIQRFSRRLSKEEGQWETVFALSEEQKAAIHKDLEWILSLPLKDPASRETLAVLNIDGLDHALNDGILASMAVRSVAEIYAMEILLAEQAKTRLILGRRSYGNA